MVAYAEAGPEKGTVWPILISVSLAPVSYFFCAKADETDSASVSAAPVARWKNPFLMSMRSSYVCLHFADGPGPASPWNQGRLRRWAECGGCHSAMQDEAARVVKPDFGWRVDPCMVESTSR